MTVIGKDDYLKSADGHDGLLKGLIAYKLQESTIICEENGLEAHDGI